MAEPGSNGATRDLLERIALAAVGAVTLTAERADALADELADRGMVRRDEARALIDEVTARWRGDATRFGEMAGSTLDRLFRELGLVTKDEVEELELRVAQLEHRLRLAGGSARKGFSTPRATLRACPSKRYTPASGPRSRCARAHPPPHQGSPAFPRRSPPSGLVLATQKRGSTT